MMIKENHEIPELTDPEVLAAINSFQLSKTLEKQAKKIKETAEEVFMRKLVANGILIGKANDKILKLTSVTKTYFDQKTFKEQHKELYNYYTKETKYNMVSLTDANQ